MLNSFISMKLLARLSRSLREYRRIISISRKPNRQEFASILKITSLGISLIGAVGFAIQLLYQFIIKVFIQ